MADSMTSVLKWSAAFKEIHGRKPTKSDYNFSPSHVKEEYFASCVANSSTKSTAPQRVKVHLKRPRLDSEENSPVKKRHAKTRRRCGDSGAGDFTSPSKVCFPSSNCVLSSVELDGIVETKLKILECTSETSNSFCSPGKIMKSPSKIMPILSSFTSLFDTPEKGKPAIWGEVSPQKRIVATRISSPRKPCIRKGLSVQNAKYLLLPTPEKRKQRILEPFESEEIPQKGSASGKNMAETSCSGKGHLVKKAIKRRILKSAPKSKKQEGNYVKINLRKKLFSRGKVSAEQKRKMRRKQFWKKRMGAGG